MCKIVTRCNNQSTAPQCDDERKSTHQPSDRKSRLLSTCRKANANTYEVPAENVLIIRGSHLSPKFNCARLERTVSHTSRVSYDCGALCNCSNNSQLNRVLVLQSLEGRCHGKQILLVLVPRCRWRQAVSGAAGRANVGLCPASSFYNNFVHYTSILFILSLLWM